MKKILLFTDGSVNTKTNIGCGAYFYVEENNYKIEEITVVVKRFKETSSTKLELQTLLWALKEITEVNSKIVVYTDSQNIIGLPDRRKRLEINNYHSKNNKLLKNHELYREFYQFTTSLNCEFLKIQGHLVSNQKNELDKLFTLVDRASRKALRERKDE